MLIKSMLSGGNPRSLGNTEAVVQSVLLSQDKLNELYNCLFTEDKIVRMRAGDALEKICHQHPEWLRPYVDSLLSEVAIISQPSIQWHVVQMIGKLQLDKNQRIKATNILKNNLETATDWLVLNYSLEVFAQFARVDKSLVPYFKNLLERHAHNKHKSVAKRARNLLASF